MSVMVIAPLPVTARMPFGMLEASMAPKDVLSVALPRASRTLTLPPQVSAPSAPAMFSSQMLQKELRVVRDLPPADVPFTRPLVVVHSTRPLMSEKLTLPKLLEMVAAPPTV